MAELRFLEDVTVKLDTVDGVALGVNITAISFNLRSFFGS